MKRVVFCVSFFLVSSVYGGSRIPRGMQLDFGLEESAKLSQALPSCDQALELAPGVKNRYCLGSLEPEFTAEGTPLSEFDLLEQIRNSETEQEILYLISQYPILKRGSALLAFCGAGLLSFDHVSCNMEFEF